ncbi:MAG: hypothetical protein WDN06_05000 [Asticcacaulis sp.]
MSVFRRDKSEHPLLMELPSYRLPNGKSLPWDCGSAPSSS